MGLYTSVLILALCSVAAERQVEETRHQRGEEVGISPHPPRTSPQESSVGNTAETSSTAHKPHITPHELHLSRHHTGRQDGGRHCDIQRTMEVLSEKIAWATEELAKNQSVEASVQLIRLIKECVELQNTLKIILV